MTIEGAREEMETSEAVSENLNLLNRSMEVREEGRKEDELRILERVDPEYFEGYIRHEGEEVDYGMVIERIAELKIELNIEPELETLRRAINYNPENEDVIEHLVEKGEKNLRDGDIEESLRYFEAVPESYDDFHFLEDLRGVS